MNICHLGQKKPHALLKDKDIISKKRADALGDY